MNQKDMLGRHGEQLAADYLAQAGYQVLDRNWRCAEGELDIVAADGGTLVACEVKTRSGTGFGAPLEVITRSKRSRLRRLAVRWLLSHGVIFEEVRVDVVGVLVRPDGQVRLEHAQGVG